MKNRSKNEVNMGRAPGLHFFGILMDLGTQLRANLGGKSEPREEKTGQDRYERVLEKRCEKRTRLGLVLGGGGANPGRVTLSRR